MPGFQLNYLKESDRIIGSHTAAGAAKPDFAALNKGKKRKWLEKLDAQKIAISNHKFIQRIFCKNLEC